MSVFPARIEEISAELLTKILSERAPGVLVKQVVVKDHAQCGDGLASTADRVCLSLTYGEGQDAGLPKQVMLKTIFLHSLLRFGLPMIIGLARFVNLLDKVPLVGKLARPLIFTLINIYQRYFPHAPEAMYANEVNFYRSIRPEVELEAPASYASVIDEGNGQFGILMEDLGLRSARFPSAVEGVSLDVMKNLITNLAVLHAAYWQSPRFEKDLCWLPTTTKGGMYPVFDAIGLDIIRDQVAKNKFKQDLLAPLNRSVDALWAGLWKSQEIIYQQPLTLLHGDTHIGNTYIHPDGTAGLLDWQLMVKGPWCHDITYMMITGLDVETRRSHEKDLLNLYRETLLEKGVKSVPTEAQAWLLYRQTAIWGLVIGWLITPPQNYGEEITAANVSKMCTAMLDLQTLESIGC